MSEPKPLFDIVIPNWNGKAMLGHCLESLHKQTFRQFIVTVVDNGSTDGSVQLLCDRYPWVKVMEMDHNTGFSCAVNAGILAGNCEWVVLLNNDMEVAPDCLEQLTMGVRAYPDTDFFALKMMSFNQRDHIDGAGDGVLRGGVGYRLGTLEKDQTAYQEDRSTFGACAGAALYRRNLLSRCGLFDEEFFAYLEDVDWNMRARRYGARCMFLANAKVYHIGSATSGSKINPFTIRLSTRNNLWVLIKNYDLYLGIRFLLPLLMYQFAWLIFCLKKRMVHPYCQGVYEGIRGMGKMMRKRPRQQQKDMLSRARFGDLILASEREVVNSIMARRAAAGKNNLVLHMYRLLFL